MELIQMLCDELEQVDRFGEFCAYGEQICPMPVMRVAGMGQVSFPIPSYQAEQLKGVGELAPYGRGTATLVDVNVRRTYQIDASGVELPDPVWARTLAGIVAEAASKLGAGGARAELYKLLVYDVGAFFAPHRDTEKCAGMFGTLVVSLPTPHEGGGLRIHHQGQTVRVDFGGQAVWGLRWAAFYADCQHEVEPVTEGARICLVYNLVRDGQLASPEHRRSIEKISAVLGAWSGAVDGPSKLCYLLAHRYTSESTRFSALKDEDAAAARVLVGAAAVAGCDIYLARVSFEQSGSAENLSDWSRYRRRDEEEFEICEVFDEVRSLQGWVGTDDQPVVLPSLRWTEEELFPPGAWSEVESDEVLFTEATGNEGASFERSYVHTALVMWPRKNRVSILLEGDWKLLPEAILTLSAEEARRFAGPMCERLLQRYFSEISGSCSASVLVGLLKFGLVSEAAEWVEHTLRRIAEVGHLKSATPGDGLLITPSGREVRLLPTLSFSPSTLGLKSEEAEPLAAWLQHSPAVFGPILARLVDHGVEYRGVATGDLLVACSTLSPTLFAPLATAALRRMSRTVTKAEGRVPGWIGSQTFRLLCSAFSAHPDLLAFFEVCLKGLPEKLDAPRILAVALLALPPVARPVGLRTFATAGLTRMIQNPPIKPTNWVRDAAVRCECQDCGDLQSFMASPKHDSWSFRARQELRSHVERSLVGLDVSTRTLRSGSPHTLIVTKTLASYERSLARLDAAKRALELLKGGQPGELLPALEG